jgi:Ras-related C3 botulinum toxin substrate 1
MGWVTLDYDRTRPLSYPETQVFLVCISTVNMTSYENVKAKWVPEVRQFSKEVPIVLCGTKMDLRNDPEYVKKITDNGESIVTTEDGLRLMREVEAVAYNECSAKSHKGLKEVFSSCIKAVLDPPKKEQDKQSQEGCCILL